MFEQGITGDNIFYIASLFGILATFFLTKTAAGKALIDQLHLRINRNLEDQHKTELKVARLEGINEGIEKGRNQVFQEIQIAQIVTGKKDDGNSD